jgi:hypothetical protein
MAESSTPQLLAAAAARCAAEHTRANRAAVERWVAAERAAACAACADDGGSCGPRGIFGFSTEKCSESLAELPKAANALEATIFEAVAATEFTAAGAAAALDGDRAAALAAALQTPSKAYRAALRLCWRLAERHAPGMLTQGGQGAPLASRFHR